MGGIYRKRGGEEDILRLMGVVLRIDAWPPSTTWCVWWWDSCVFAREIVPVVVCTIHLNCKM